METRLFLFEKGSDKIEDAKDARNGALYSAISSGLSDWLTCCRRSSTEAAQSSGAMAKVDDAACRVASETLGGLVPYDVVPHAVAARDASVPRPVVPLASQMPAEANRFEGSTTLAPRRPQSTLSVVQSRMP